MRNGVLTSLLLGALVSVSSAWGQCTANSQNGLTINIADPNGCNCGTFNFYDEGGPNSGYNSNRRDTVRFVNPGGRLQIWIASWSLEGCTDNLSIYDGNSTGSGLMYRLCNNGGNVLLFSTHDTVTFVFYSNGSYVYSGWHIQLACLSGLNRQEMPPAPAVATLSSCTEVISFFDDGGPNQNYSPNQNRTWVVRPPSSSDLLQVAFPYQLSIEAGDTLWIWSGNRLLARFTQGSSRADTLTAIQPGDSLTFRFKSDINIGTTAGGWGALITCATTPAHVTYMGPGLRTVPCGRTIRFFDSGSPGLNGDNGRSDYGNYANESRVITFFSQDSSQRLRIAFSALSTEGNWDWLEIYDGPTLTSPLIGRWSGFFSTPPIILSTGPYLTVRFFTSNASTNFSGWQATVSCTSLPVPPIYTLSASGQTASVCEALFYDDGNASGPYSPDQDRTFTICPDDPTKYLVVSFPYQFQLAAGDTLWVYEGSSTSAPLVGVYILNNIGEQIASQVPGGCLTFRFKAAATSPGAPGWHGIVRCSSTPEPLISWMGYGIRRTCNMLLYDSGGPDFNYWNNENRQLLIIRAQSGCGALGIQFTNFATESGYDILRIYNGGTTGSSSSSFSGSSLPNSGNPLLMSGDSMLIRFTSDGSVNYSGWRAQIRCANTFSAAITPNVTLPACAGTPVTLQASPSGSSYTYSWNSGATSSSITVTTAGTYSVTVTDQNGCQATAAYTVSYHPAPDTTVTWASGTLTGQGCDANHTCRWRNCNSGQIVATGPSFTPTQGAAYRLLIKNNTTQCEDSSSCHYVVTSYLAALGSSFVIYPNPSTGAATLEASMPIARLFIYNLSGQMVFEASQAGSTRFMLPTLAPGLYEVSVTFQNGNTRTLRWQVLR